MGNYGDTYAQAVARRLRMAREAHLPEDRKTYEELQDELDGIAKSTLINYFLGRRAIPIPVFLELCRALGVDAGEILDEAKRDVDRAEHSEVDGEEGGG